MDKIASHIIQMNLNPQSLNSRVSDSEASNLKVSEASDTWVSEALDSRVSKASNRVLVSDPSVSDPRSGLGGLGPDGSQALTWACELLGLTKVDS